MSRLARSENPLQKIARLHGFDSVVTRHGIIVSRSLWDGSTLETEVYKTKELYDLLAFWDILQAAKLLPVD